MQAEAMADGARPEHVDDTAEARFLVDRKGGRQPEFGQRPIDDHRLGQFCFFRHVDPRPRQVSGEGRD